ncbi:MAG: respiratory nitrate reductase subunit gamma [Bilophila sp.]
MNTFFFAIYPYICVTLLVLGVLFRYVATPEAWNARSSEVFERKALRIGSPIFHYAILLSFLGHVGGLLTPDWVMRLLHVPTEVHLEVALITGQVLAPLVIVGLGILLWRRLTNCRVFATTEPMDIVIVVFILINACTGLYQAYVSQFSVFTTIGPWLRGAVLFSPDVALMLPVPFFMQLHVVSGFAIFAMLPFSRLVHILSVPVTYAVRPFIVFRRRYGGI